MQPPPLQLPLPNDIDALKAIIGARDAELYAQSLLIEKLKLQLGRNQRHRFGPQSEGLDQLELTIEEIEIGLTRGAPRADEAMVAPPLKDQPKRKPLPDHLPREVAVHTPKETQCEACGKPMRKMGEDVREILDFVPGRFIVRRHVCEKLSCRECGRIVEAELASMPIEKGAPGAGLLAHILISKYCDHLPLYRQSEIYAREDVDLSRSTMAGWVGKMADLLAPLAERIAAHVLGAAAIHTDDTPIPVLDPGRGRTKTGRYWTHVRDERSHGSTSPPAAFYRYSPDRKGERPREHLKNYTGFLHADGYAGYEQLYSKTGVTEVACMAHIRRNFFDIHKATSSPVAAETLLRIAALYEIETRVRGKLPDERRRLRQAEAAPLFEDLQGWLGRTLPSLPNRGELAKAMRYAITRMKRLKVYLEDGRLEIDNNIAERSVRGIALGKKNYLFAGSDKGGEHGAVIYTLIETAKLNGVDPQAWLAHVIENIAGHSITRIDDFLPWNFRPCAS
jgi:transposase